MKAAIARKHGGPEVIEIADVPPPPPLSHPSLSPDSVLLAVRAAALNHLDLWVLRGLPGLELDFPHIGGADMAGTVAEVGAGVEGFAPGDRVLVNPGLWDGECEWCLKGEESLCKSYRILGEHVNGGFAELIAVPARNLLPIPDDLSFVEAAAVPLAYQTAWRGLMRRAALQAGETVLVTGASGGVATAAIQIARHAGATVYAVTSGPEKVRRVRELGAEDRKERPGQTDDPSDGQEEQDPHDHRQQEAGAPRSIPPVFRKPAREDRDEDDIVDAQHDLHGGQSHQRDQRFHRALPVRVKNKTAATFRVF